MSEEAFTQAIIYLCNYLEKTRKAPENFKEEIEKTIRPFDRYLDRNYPYYLIVDNSWLLVFIATYTFKGKRISIDLVAYLDQDIVRFLRTPSCLKFNDSLPEVAELSDKEKVNLFLSERYLLPFSTLLHPYHESYYSQRLLLLINRIIDNTQNQGFKELLRFLNEILTRNSFDMTPDVTYHLDEILLILDDLANRLPPIQKDNPLVWKRTLVLKIKALIILLKPDENLRHHYQRKLILISLLMVTPYLDSSYLRSSFEMLQEQLGYAQVITLNFLESLLDDIEGYLISQNRDYQRFKKWEQAMASFFSFHREACFALPKS